MKSSHAETVGDPISVEDYRTLATFRRALRRFLKFSEDAARNEGLTPQQHQAILAIKGYGPEGMGIGDLADQLLIRPHSAVELVDRLVAAGLAARAETPADRRRVVVALTPKAEAVLEHLSATHLAELRRSRPLLLQLLRRVAGR